MPYPDQKVYFNPDENLSSQDANFISEFLAEVHKLFVVSAMTQVSCRISGLGVSFTNNSTPSPTVNIANGLAFFVLPDPKNITDPNNYSGAIFAGGDNIGISAPPLSTRSDAIDITYNEQLGNDGGSIGFQSPRDVIDNLGVITPNVPMYTRKISNYVVTYIPDYPSFNGGQPATGTVRLATFTVTTAGFCSGVTYVMPSIWENQDWPTGSPNIADQSATLADSLASIRFQLNAIIGNYDWFSALGSNNILNLVQLGNAPKYWGSTSAGSTPTYNLTILNFPINASIIPGTVIGFKPNFTNPGAVNISVNGHTAIPLNDATNTAFLGGELIANNLYEVMYTGSTFQILGNATPVFTDLKTEVVNGSFEEWSAGLPIKWSILNPPTLATLNREHSATAVDGGNAARFDVGFGGSISLSSDLIPMSALKNTYIKFKTWSNASAIGGNIAIDFLKYDGVTPTATGAFQTFWNSPVSYPATATTYYNAIQSSSGGLSLPSGFTTVVSPTDARYFRITMFLSNPSTSGSAWFDDYAIFTPGCDNKITYYSPGSYNIRTGPNTTNLIIEGMSGGGSGGNGFGAVSPSSGGGSAAYAKWYSWVNPDTVYTLVVGAGATGVAQASDGNAGGNTSFNGVTITGGGAGHWAPSGTVSGGSAGSPPAKSNANRVIAAIAGNTAASVSGANQGAGAPAFSSPSWFNPPWTNSQSAGGNATNGGTSGAGNGGEAVIYS